MGIDRVTFSLINAAPFYIPIKNRTIQQDECHTVFPEFSSGIKR